MSDIENQQDDDVLEPIEAQDEDQSEIADSDHQQDDAEDEDGDEADEDSDDAED